QQDRIDHCRTPEGDAVGPALPALPGVAAQHGGSVEIENRLLTCNVLRDVELRHVTIHDLVGAAVISISAAVPGDNDAFLIQHGERAMLRVCTHRGVHQRAASQQYAPPPGANPCRALDRCGYSRPY